MRRFHHPCNSWTVLLTVAVLMASPAGAEEKDPLPLRNWPVPQSSAEGKVTAMADLTHGSIFFGMQPCRVVDTRDPDGPYGGPKLVGQRTFDIDSGPCTGIPEGVSAYSLAFGVTQTEGDGAFLTAWPTGQTQPGVATITWNAGQTLVNTVVLPAGFSGAIDAFAAAPTHLTIDINGYWVDTRANPGRHLWFRGDVASSLVFVRNFSESSGPMVNAIAGLMNTTADGATAIRGRNEGLSGANFGVRGWNNSSGDGAAGVLGTAGTEDETARGLFGTLFGVFGKAERALGFAVGVYGEKRSGTSGRAVEGVYLNSTNSGLASRAALGCSETVAICATGNFSASGTKNFVEPHRSDPSLVIKFTALEGDEAGTYFRGRSRFVGRYAVIPVPEHFRIVSAEEGLTVTVTPIGDFADVAVVSMDLHKIVIKSTKDVEFSFMVNGVRRAYADFEPIQSNEEFVPTGPDDRMPTALAPELQQRLIDSGIYRADGTVNLETAERMGWAAQWHQPVGRVEARSSELGLDVEKDQP